MIHFQRIVTEAFMLVAFSLLVACSDSAGGNIGRDASPDVVTRGQVLARTPLGSKSRLEINQDLGGIGIGQNDVAVYQIRYSSLGVTGQPNEVSALLVMPDGVSGPFPLLSYQHGTAFRRVDAPSMVDLGAPLFPAATEALISGLFFASLGYATIVADYIGLGLSQEEHPYLHAASEATAVVDALRAARQTANDLGVTLTGKLFLAGFSQGGHATLAAQRSIEHDHADEFAVTASAPMDGPLDLSGATLSQILAGKPYPAPSVVAYVLLAYNHIYRLGVTDAGLFAPELATTLPLLFDGNHSSDLISRAMLPVDTAPPKDPLLSLNSDFLAAIRQDEHHPLREALRQNDVYDWAPRAPIRIYQCSGDDITAPANAEVAFRALTNNGADVKLVDPAPGSDHIGCVGPGLLAVQSWFDTLR